MPKVMRILTVLILAAGLGRAATIVLKRAWVEKFKDRATIEASFTVDHAHPRPNPPANDGDMHVAGRAAKEIGLPMVAEIMNAKEFLAGAVKAVHDVEGQNQSIQVSGAWRLWFEHPPSSATQTQFASVPPAANTNPDHCFEIHPLTVVAGNNVVAGLHEIDGFTPKDAQKAFEAYEKLSVAIRATKTGVTLASTKSGFNYVQFRFRAVGQSKPLADGGVQVMANVVGGEGDQDEAIAENVRMIFVPDSEPAKKVAGGLNDGDELTVLGIPRLNLNAISAALTAAESSVVKRKLPYEMIIVALAGEDAGGKKK